MITVEQLGRAYAEHLEKDLAELAEIRITQAPVKLEDPLVIGLELVIQTDHVRYIRVGSALLGVNGIKFVDRPSLTRLTVPIETVPVGGVVQLACGIHGREFEYIEKWHSTATNEEFHELRAFDSFGAYSVLEGTKVEATCYVGDEGLVMAGIPVATLDEIKEADFDPVDMSNGCKFDVWDWGSTYYYHWREQHAT